MYHTLEVIKMKVYKNRLFTKWAKTENINDKALKTAIEEIEQGLFDAKLGGNIYKKRVPRKGEGKRGGYRTFLAFKSGDKAIFIFGFAKNERENITGKEEEGLKELCRYYFLLSDVKISEAVKEGELTEVK